MTSGLELEALDEEAREAGEKLETQIAEGKIDLDAIIKDEAESQSARANELKVISNAHRELLKKRLRAKRKRAEAKVKSLSKAEQTTILDAIDEEIAEATQILENKLSNVDQSKLSAPLAEIAEEDGKQRAALERNMKADAEREKARLISDACCDAQPRGTTSRQSKLDVHVFEI